MRANGHTDFTLPRILPDPVNLVRVDTDDETGLDLAADGADVPEDIPPGIVVEAAAAMHPPAAGGRWL